jgi:hypothetical protein
MPASKPGRFTKGQSGNPGGASRAKLAASADLAALARLAAPKGLAALLRVLDDKTSPASAVVMATVALWDRGFGKPTQPVESLGLDRLVEVLERRRLRAGSAP